MDTELPNYLRTYRKRTYLSQEEVAFLLGSSTGMKIYRYERFLRQPSLETIIGYTILFGESLEEFFPGIYEKVENKINERAQTLTRKLDGASQHRLTERKREFLETLVSRLDAEPVEKQ